MFKDSNSLAPASNNNDLNGNGQTPIVISPNSHELSESILKTNGILSLHHEHNNDGSGGIDDSGGTVILNGNTVILNGYNNSNSNNNNPKTNLEIANLKNVGLCEICGDRGSGYHYSVYSCEGCKGFFKRTVQKDLQYKCREYQQCVVNKQTRNQCQFCRFQKCLITGMKRDAVREDRTPSVCHFVIYFYFFCRN